MGGVLEGRECPAATLTSAFTAASLMPVLMQGWFQKLVCGTVAKPYNITRSTLVGGMCSICCHMALVLLLTFMHFVFFNLRLLLSILFYFIFLFWY